MDVKLTLHMQRPLFSGWFKMKLSESVQGAIRSSPGESLYAESREPPTSLITLGLHEPEILLKTVNDSGIVYI